MHNLTNDDLALVRLLLSAVQQPGRFSTYQEITEFLKYNLDLSVRPASGTASGGGEWSVLLMRDLHGRLSAVALAAYYVPLWERTALMIFS